MKTAIIVTVFGKWDEASTQLRKMGYHLTLENTVEVPDERLEEAQERFQSLVDDGIIDAFSL